MEFGKPDPAAEGKSVNEYLASLPRRRAGISPNLIGRPLSLPRSGAVVVPYDYTARGEGWTCIVLVSAGSSYVRGGYDVIVSTDELARAIECRVELP